MRKTGSMTKMTEDFDDLEVNDQNIIKQLSSLKQKRLTHQFSAGKRDQQQMMMFEDEDMAQVEAERMMR